MMNKFKEAETIMTELAASIGPWLAPLPSAFFVYRSGMLHLGMTQAIALVAAAVIELLGLASTSITLTLYEYNQTKRKSDPVAPTWLAFGLVMVYFVTTILLAVVLDAIPSLAQFAPAIFPLLSLAGVGVLALRIDQRRRLDEIEKGKNKRQNQRKTSGKTAGKRPENAPVYSGGSNGSRPAIFPSTSGKTRDRARAILEERPEITGSELGRLLGRSERLGRMLKKEYLAELSEMETANEAS